MPGALSAVIFTTLVAADTAGKAGTVGAELMLLNITSFRGTAIIRPAVFPHGGLPTVWNNASILKIEHHFIRSGNFDVVDLFRKDGFIKFVQPEDGSTGFLQHWLGNVLVLTLRIPGFPARTANPDRVIGIGVFTALAVGPLIAFTASSTLYFAGEAGSVDAPVGEYTEFPAAGFFLLHRLVNFHRNDGFVGILNPILRKFTLVLAAFLADGVYGVFLLEEKISGICDVAENLPYGCVAEMLSLVRLHAHFFKLLFSGLC